MDNTVTKTEPMEQTAPIIERAEYPVGDTCFRGLLQPADLLEDVEGNVGQGNAQAGKHGLHQETGRLLMFRNRIGNKGTERFHCSIVTDVQEPQQQYGNPQCGNVRIDEEAEAATDGTD